MSELGVIDENIEEHQAFYGLTATERHKGLPYPATFMLDGDGVVASKQISQRYRERTSPSLLLDHAGRSHAPKQLYVAESSDVGVVFRLFTDTLTYRPMQLSVLYLDVEIVDGFHVYAEPVPPGYIPLTVELLETPTIRPYPYATPSGTPFRVEGLDESFHVIDGKTRVSLPYLISGAHYLLDGRGRDEPITDEVAVLTVTVSYQVCSEYECFPPGVRHLSVPFVETPLITD